MSVTAEQLEKIYSEIQEKFLASTLVDIQPMEGDPPETYRITYNFTGKSRNDAGEVIESTGHIVDIAIPFGFPHFSPNCRPVSPIFHPDFTADAIAIGDFWTAKSRLPALIEHIGEMINGTFYSTANGFNDEAMAWYLKNCDQFPLSSLQWDESRQPQSVEKSAPLVKKPAEQEKVQKNGSNPPDAERQDKREKSSLFASFSRKMVLLTAALSLGTGLAATLYFWAEKNIEKAETLLQDCTSSLAKREYQAASSACSSAREAAQRIVLLFPAKKAELSVSVTTILQSEALKLGLAGKISIDGKPYPIHVAENILAYRQKREHADSIYLAQQFQQAATEYAAALQLADKGSFLEPQARQMLETLTESARFHAALQLAEQQKEAGEWSAMRQTTEKARELLNRLSRTEKTQFGPVVLLKELESRFGMAQQDADDALNQGKWAKAISSYNTVLQLARQQPNMPPAELQEIRNRQARASLYQSLEQGNNSFLGRKWNEAIAAYTQANAILTDPTLTLFAKEKSERHNRRLKKIILQAAIVRDQESIKELLSNDELTSARDMYRKVLKLIRSSTFQKEKEFTRVEQEILNKIKNLDHQLYRNGKKAYLEKNYRELFTSFYQNLDEKSLQPPDITIVEEDDNALLFRLECTEKRAGSRPLTLLMTCRYDKKSGKWSIVADSQ